MVCLSIDALTWRKIEECCEVVNKSRLAGHMMLSGTAFVESLLVAYYTSGGSMKVDLEIQPRMCGRYRQVYLDMIPDMETLLRSRAEDLGIPLERLILGIVSTYTGGTILKS